MKWQWQQAVLAANENVNENFHPDNYQLSISELRSLCHATPKINFFHLEKDSDGWCGVNKFSRVCP